MAGHAGLHLWGIDHRLAPTEVRERAHIDPERVGGLLAALAREPGFVSAVPVSTCNRTEIYVESLPGFAPFEGLTRSLAAAGLDPALFTGEYGVRLTDGEAVRRLYRVSAGLESMMLGEPQISGQLKDAYRLAKEHHELGPVLMRAFQGAFRAGKRVRTETKIGEGAVSVAFAAVELARKFFADLSRGGWTVADTTAFGDHHRYTRGDVDRVAAAARAAGAVMVLTTEKDLVRMLPLRPLPMPVAWVPLRVGAEPAAEFSGWLLERCSAGL